MVQRLFMVFYVIALIFYILEAIEEQTTKGSEYENFKDHN